MTCFPNSYYPGLFDYYISWKEYYNIMIKIKISYENDEELDAVLNNINKSFAVNQIKKTEKQTERGVFKKAYIFLTVKKI